MWWVWVKNNRFIVLTLTLSSLLACKPNQQVARVYLASSLAPLAKDLEEVAKDKMALDLMFVSSSAIAKHIEQSAPCDLAIVADDRWGEYLLAKGLVSKEQAIFARNNLVIASLKKSPRVSANEALALVSSKQKLIIADPDFVPLGVYTKEVLENLGLFNRLSDFLVKASSARHARLLLEQGAAPLAILYQTDVGDKKIHIVSQIEPMLHRPIHYPLLVCKEARIALVNRLKQLIFSDQFSQRLIEKGFR